MKITLETETAGDSRTMFRLRIEDAPIAEDLTAVQAHLLIGEILERIALPKTDAVRPPSLALPV